jgi:hypothetical protein
MSREAEWMSLESEEERGRRRSGEAELEDMRRMLVRTCMSSNNSSSSSSGRGAGGGGGGGGGGDGGRGARGADGGEKNLVIQDRADDKDPGGGGDGDATEIRGRGGIKQKRSRKVSDEDDDDEEYKDHDDDGDDESSDNDDDDREDRKTKKKKQKKEKEAGGKSINKNKKMKVEVKVKVEKKTRKARDVNPFDFREEAMSLLDPNVLPTFEFLHAYPGNRCCYSFFVFSLAAALCSYLHHAHKTDCVVCPCVCPTIEWIIIPKPQWSNVNSIAQFLFQFAETYASNKDAQGQRKRLLHYSDPDIRPVLEEFWRIQKKKPSKRTNIQAHMSVIK